MDSSVAATTRARIASDGNSVIHHADDSAPDCCASYSTRPHDQLFGSSRPRNARPAAVSTARDAVSTTDTTTTGATAGSRCFRMIHNGDVVISRAASMYGRCTTASACDRTTRLTSGMEKNASTPTIVCRLGPTSAATSTINGSTGSDRNMSTNIPITPSTLGKNAPTSA